MIWLFFGTIFKYIKLHIKRKRICYELNKEEIEFNKLINIDLKLIKLRNTQISSYTFLNRNIFENINMLTKSNNLFTLSIMHQYQVIIYLKYTNQKCNKLLYIHQLLNICSSNLHIIHIEILKLFTIIILKNIFYKL